MTTPLWFDSFMFKQSVYCSSTYFISFAYVCYASAFLICFNNCVPSYFFSALNKFSFTTNKMIRSFNNKELPTRIAPLVIIELCFSYWCILPLLSHQFHLGTSSSPFQHVRNQFRFFLLQGL